MMVNQVIIQARMGSTRLPGKVLLPLYGRPVLDWVVKRSESAYQVSRAVVATSELAEDDAIVEWCNDNGVACVRGSSEDVLARFLRTVELFPCDNVVRITADCPLVDPGIIDSILALHLEAGADYSSNEVPPTFPVGFDTEVIKTDVLNKIGKLATLKSHREHVTLYVRENTTNFKIVNLDSTIDGRKMRLTLDRPEDYQVLQDLMQHLSPVDHLFSYYQILQVVRNHPEILQANSGIDQFEGVKKSARGENRKLAWE
ncbi:MAG: glycosyltransferase family protein [Candidatus Riflebacteria bacterium]